MIQQVVFNGCSYMVTYARGNGHVDLIRSLGIIDQLDVSKATCLAVSGCANSRILRTTLKHSYQVAVPTLYILGMTFVSRLETPVCEPENEFEGRWVNLQNQDYKSRWQFGWEQADSDRFVELKLKSEMYSILDRTEDLMYRMLSVIADLQSRGHRVLMFQQACNLYQEYLEDSRLQLFKRPEIVDGFKWRAVPWQHEQGVQPVVYPPGTVYPPPDMVHPKPGQHALINQYLTNYIQEHKILA